MFTTGLHHVAYRCNDAQETVDFYTKVLKLPYIMAFSEDRVPSTKEPDPYMHIFFDIGDGSALAFFELPNSKPPQKDPNTPGWVQHLALKVKDYDTLLQAKATVEGMGLDVIGPTDHGLFKSIYFFDPNGHRLELACDIGTKEMFNRASSEAPAMLAEWNKSKKVQSGTHWLHAKELDPK